MNLLEKNLSADNLIAWVREYATTRIDSRSADERNCFAPHVYLDLGNQGFFRMHVPSEYGGLDFKTHDLLRVIEQVGAIDLTLATFLVESVQAAHTLRNYASDDIKSKYLPELAAGRVFIAGAMTESSAGSNPRAMKTEAKPIGEDRWELSGSKRWVGMGSWASLIAVYVQQFDEKNNFLGMSGFLVPSDATGLHIGDRSQTMGIRAIEKHTIYLQGVEVTKKQLLGQVGQGMEIAQDNMMYVRLCLAAANIGAMKRCAQLMHRYAEERTIATGKLLENPVTLACLSELTVSISALESFVYFIAELIDENPSAVPEETLVASKILGSELLGWAVDRLLQTLGARGYEENSGVSQIFRDARTFRIFEGPTEALTMYLGSRMLTLNMKFRDFFCGILKQSDLFGEISRIIKKIMAYHSSEKKTLFSQQLPVDYWLQAVLGDVVIYSLLLGVVTHKTQANPSDIQERALIWVREKFNEITKRALKFTPAEKTLLQSVQLNKLIKSYESAIGDVDQTPIRQQSGVDDLLRKNVVSTQDPKSLLKTDQNPLFNKIKSTSSGSNYLDICVHELFEKKAEKNLDSVALIDYKESLTYGMLNTRANQLAHYLIKLGITTDKLVGICLDRSSDMIIAVLAVLKSGAAYLPLDQRYPKERLTFMVENSKAEVILTKKELAENFSKEQHKIVLIDELSEKIALESNENPAVSKSTENLAYTIYTSGSTGVPKGVMLTHKSLTNLIQWQQELIKAKRNVLQFTSLSFDMSFLEIFSAFISGGKLVIISEHDRLNLFSFSKIIKKHAIEQIMLSVSFLKELAESKIDTNYFLTLKEIIISGEQFPSTPAVTQFFEKLENCKFFNYYGPSETHVVSAYQLPEKNTDWPKYIPIGLPIPNSHFLVLDEQMQPVPEGKIGELYVMGVSLARGYINNIDLTEEKFIVEQSTQQRLYRTGDFVKCLPDGNFVFVGRKDEQMKILGHRVELQSIESHLSKNQYIKDAAVIVRTNCAGHKQLEVFFVTTSVVDADFIRDIREYLCSVIPYYMVPSVFHPIDKIPTTLNGKIDKIELGRISPKKTLFSDDSKNEKLNRETEIERALVAVLNNFFHITLDVSDSFISIGGNSLLAMTISSQLFEKLHVEIPAHLILSTPTISGLAKRIGEISLNEKQKGDVSFFEEMA